MESGNLIDNLKIIIHHHPEWSLSSDPSTYPFSKNVATIIVKTRSDIVYLYGPLPGCIEVFNKIDHQNKNLYLEFNKSSETMKFITLNMGINVMGNILSGSEEPQVEICQQYGNLGWYDKSISVCTKNATDILSKYSIIALQEVNMDYISGLVANIKIPNFKYFLATYHAYLLFGYNEEFFGRGIQITPDSYPFPTLSFRKTLKHKLTDIRAIQAVYFPKFELLCINLHAPHKIDLYKSLDMAFDDIAKLLGNKRVRSVIVMGDFNDDKRILLNKKFYILGLEISIFMNRDIRSCCRDVNYIYSGDYIMVSNDINLLCSYYGLPLGYNRDDPKFLVSDHDPVVLE